MPSAFPSDWQALQKEIVGLKKGLLEGRGEIENPFDQ